MTFDQLIRHFGSQAKTAAALGVTLSAVNQWKREVPEVRQFHIELVTGGKLRAVRKKKKRP